MLAGSSLAALFAMSVAVLTAIPSVAHARSEDLIGFLGGASIDDATQQLNKDTADRIDQLLTGFDTIANQLLSRGSDQASLLEIQASNSMRILVSSARTQFADEMGNQFSRASEELKPILVQLERWRLSLDKLTNTLIGIEDLVALDTLSIPFTSNPSIIRRIYGGVLVQSSPGTYYIDLLGQGFGADASDLKTAVDIKINGHSIPATKRIPPYDIIFNIPKDIVSPLFSESDSVELRLDITVIRTKSGLFRPKVENFSSAYTVTLLPTKLGTLGGNRQFRRFEWHAVSPDPTPYSKLLTDAGQLGPISSPSPILGGNPIVGNMRFVADTIVASCIANIQAARIFANGKTLPVDDPVFKNGRRASNNCGSKGDRDAAIESIAGEFNGLFGSHWNAGNIRCSEGEYPAIHPYDLLNPPISEPSTMDVSGCRDMKADPNPYWEPDGNTFTMHVSGTPLNPAKAFFNSNPSVKDPERPTGSNARWNVSYRMQVYEAAQQMGSEEITPIEMTVGDPSGDTKEVVILGDPKDTIARLKFKPTMGLIAEGTAGSPLGYVVPDMSPKVLNDRVIYYYTFRYPNLNLNPLRKADGLPAEN